jgi:adenylate cyclase
MARRLAAIMFTDLVGSTQLAQRDERAALALLREQESLSEPLLAAHGGRVVKSTGDGMLIEFPNARDAVEYSVAFQRVVHARNIGDGRPALQVRIGIHVGDVESKGKDIPYLCPTDTRRRSSSRPLSQTGILTFER